MADDVSSGCIRLAAAVQALGRANGLDDDFRAAAVPYYRGEAAVFEMYEEDIAGVYRLLDDMMGEVDPFWVHVRVDQKHGVLGYAIVPLTGEAAAELAANLERSAAWRNENPRLLAHGTSTNSKTKPPAQSEPCHGQEDGAAISIRGPTSRQA